MKKQLLALLILGILFSLFTYAQSNIKIGTFDAGIVGLEEALRSVYLSGVTDKDQVQDNLL